MSKDEDAANKIIDQELGPPVKKSIIVGGFFFNPWVMWGGVAFGLYTMTTGVKQI